LPTAGSHEAATSEILSSTETNYQRRPDSCEGFDKLCLEIDHEYIRGLSPTWYRQFRNFPTAHAYCLSNLTVQYQYGLLTDEHDPGGVIGAIKGLMPSRAVVDVPQRRRLALYVEACERENR
jgi:hypothetical protein